MRSPAAAQIFAVISSAGTSALPAMWPQRLGLAWSSKKMAWAPSRS